MATIITTVIKYKNTLDGCYNFIDFPNEYQEQYLIPLNTYNTYKSIDKVLNDSFDGTNADRIELALNIIEEYLYIDNGKNRYSVRKLATIRDKHCLYIHKSIIDLYEKLENISITDLKEHPSIFKAIRKGVSKEVALLNKVKFDYVVNENITYKKANNTYTLYISKMSLMYAKRFDFINDYKKSFYSQFGINLTDKEMEELTLIIDLISHLNNGLIRLMTKENKKYNTYAYNDYIDLYKDYLSNNLHIELDNATFKDNVLIFFKEVMAIRSNKSINISEILTNFDYYYFIDKIEKIINNEIKLTINNDFVNKLIKDLKVVYYELIKVISNNDFNNISREVLLPIYKLNKDIIKRNKKVFERIS